MKRALLKDTFREIKHSLSRFLSIFAIVALGVAFFAGLKATGPDMKTSADKYFDDNRLSDIHILSAVGFNSGDVTAIRETAGVKDAMPSYSIDAIVNVRDRDLVIKVLSLPSAGTAGAGESNINRTALVAGRYPENPGECVAEKGRIANYRIDLGMTIELSSGTGKNMTDLLDRSTYTVVGLVQSPYYISYERGTSAIGNGKINSYIMIPEDDFKLPVFTDIFVTVKGAMELPAYDKKYDNIVAPAVSSLEETGTFRKQAWYVLDRKSNSGFVEYGSSADRLDAIASVFPVFFLLVSALVCLTTMTRMVDEQRISIGTFKALGYGKGAIAFKYLLYAALASVSGSVFGFMVGFNTFPKVIANAYGMMFTLNTVTAYFNLFFAGISTAAAVLTTTLTAWFACNQELAMVPAALMLPKAPRPGKRIILERVGFIWSKLNFTQKITARNLLRYKKRFFMTVIGIGGCTALLLSGFGLKDSIASIAIKQFNEIFKYNMIIGMKFGVTSDNATKLAGVLSNEPRISDHMLNLEMTVTASSGGVDKTAMLFVPESIEQIGRFITFRNRVTGKNVSLTDSGVILSEKLAANLKVSVGGEISVKVGDTPEVKVKVAGITENYFSHYVYMSPALYNQVFGQSVAYKEILAKTTDTSENFENALSTDIMKNTEVGSVSFTTSISKTFNDVINSLNFVVAVIIFSAGALAFIVLYNLTNINVTERMREIATIKVLGFYDKEVSSYVYRENALLTIIGIIIGLVLGIFLHRFVVITAEVDFVMFGRMIKPASYLYASALTVLFSGLVNFVMYFRLKRISMVESMKSVD